MRQMIVFIGTLLAFVVPPVTQVPHVQFLTNDDRLCAEKCARNSIQRHLQRAETDAPNPWQPLENTQSHGT